MLHVDRVHAALTRMLPEALVQDILGSFVSSVAKFNAADHDGCLVKAGLFCEHVMRALLFDATGSVPSEIKNFGDSMKLLAKAEQLSESLRSLVPKILAASVYDLRSKRGAVHVKGVNPQKRDAALATLSMSWALAELISAYGDMNSRELDGVISTLMRRKLPLVELVGGQAIVTDALPAYLETLAIIDGHPEGISRRDVGKLVKCSSSAVTHALTKITSERLAHVVAGSWHITGKGEQILDNLVFSRR